MSFLAIKSREGEDYMNLKVIRDSLEVKPNLHITVTDLNKTSGGKLYRHFFNGGYGGLTITCSIKIHRDDVTSNGNSVKYTLHRWLYEMQPVMISTDAMDIYHQYKEEETSGLYIMTANPKRKQTSENYTTWDLEFNSYVPLTLTQYKNDNTLVQKALKTAKQSKLSKCDINAMLQGKKGNDCVKELQRQLKTNNFYLKGDIDGIMAQLTMTAIGDYQRKKKLKVTNKLNVETFKSLCK